MLDLVILCMCVLRVWYLLGNAIHLVCSKYVRVYTYDIYICTLYIHTKIQVFELTLPIYFLIRYLHSLPPPRHPFLTVKESTYVFLYTEMIL